MKQDVQISDLIRKEEDRQSEGIELIASENFALDGAPWYADLSGRISFFAKNYVNWIVALWVIYKNIVFLNIIILYLFSSS